MGSILTARIDSNRKVTTVIRYNGKCAFRLHEALIQEIIHDFAAVRAKEPTSSGPLTAAYEQFCSTAALAGYSEFAIHKVHPLPAPGFYHAGRRGARGGAIMPAAARLSDSVAGTTAGEHTGHIPPHSPLPFGGQISGGCSGDVFINGLPAATVGSITTETDACCGASPGMVAVGSSSVFINGKPAARLGDALAAHNGSGAVSSGSGDVLIGG